MYINGKWIETENKMSVINPSTGEFVYEVNVGGAKEVDDGIRAAKLALRPWSENTAIDRADLLMSVVSAMQERHVELAKVITKEMGKPLRDAKSEVNMAIEYFRWFAEEARRIYGETVPSNAVDKRLLVIKQPVGVVGAITPWNFPIAMVARKVAPALAAGCSVVMKPASQTPQSAIELVKIFDEAGIPPGVINLVIAKASVVSAQFMASPDIRKITFTGSTEVGKTLYREAAKSVKRISMELGGHAPFIVFDDADLDQAVEDLLLTKYRCSGQMCTATNRIYVQEEVLDEFSKKLAQKVNKLKVGNGEETDTVVGPLVDGGALEKVVQHVDDALDKGARLLTGGTVLKEGEYEKGHYYSPTVLADVTKEMLIYREETFGPVAPIISFSSEQQLLDEVNHDQYGLASYLYTQDMGRTIRMMEQLEYGMVGVNDPLPFVVQAPFGGVKESGLGKEGSRHGIEDYLEKKLISIRFKQ